MHLTPYLGGRCLVAFVIISVTIASSQAIQVTYLEENADRTTFQVVWGEPELGPMSLLQSGDNSDAGAIDNGTFIQIDHSNAIQPGAMPPDPTPYFDSFTLTFAPGSRMFDTATVAGFAGESLAPIPANVFGVIVNYGKPIPGGSATVADTGATASLLFLAAMALFGTRAFQERTRGGPTFPKS